MKKFNVLLIFAIFSTSMLLAQDRELTPNPKVQTNLVLDEGTTIDSNNASLNNHSSVDDNATKILLEENDKKQRDEQRKADAIAKEERKQRTLKASKAMSTKAPVSKKSKTNQSKSKNDEK